MKNLLSKNYGSTINLWAITKKSTTNEERVNNHMPDNQQEFD
jgi:hypothetical protein